jgi:hypothetical protein
VQNRGYESPSRAKIQNVTKYRVQTIHCERLKNLKKILFEPFLLPWSNPLSYKHWAKLGSIKRLRILRAFSFLFRERTATDDQRPVSHSAQGEEATSYRFQAAGGCKKPALSARNVIDP